MKDAKKLDGVGWLMAPNILSQIQRYVIIWSCLPETRVRLPPF